MDETAAAEKPQSAKGMAKDNRKLASEVQQKQLQDAQAALQAGGSLTPQQQSALQSANAESEARKNSLISSGVGALGGLASGALQGLLAKEPKPTKYSNAIPGGGNATIARSSVPDLTMSRASIASDQRPSLALEMLRRGGYK